MVTLTINGKTVAVEPGTTIIQAAEKLGIEIPHYCYHPGLPVVGQCRMCQVEVEKMPKLAIACATPVVEGMVVHTSTPQVVKARKAVLEFYLLNHPLDCPICDKGGECPLQDYTVRYGPGESRFREEKVKRIKALPIGPHVVFDAERCILCTRCVRFVQDVVGTGELGVFHRGDRAEIGLYPGRALNNLYSLNVVDLCPVGALTSRDYRFKARPWDLKSVDSICPGCSFGCNVILDVRPFDEGERIVRVRPRVNREVNGYFMCDIGRFTFKPLYQERLDQPLVRRDGRLVQTSWEEALAELASKLSTLLMEHGPRAVGAVLSSRLTNEELYLLQKFFRQVVGTESIDHRVRGVQEEGRDSQEDHLLLRADRTPNTRGARDMGVLPGKEGLDTKGMLEAARSVGATGQSPLRALFVFEEDLAADASTELSAGLPDDLSLRSGQRLGVREALSRLDLLVVQT
ncbi:MAG: 2Fe-2S iron-sulfur cluster-binding protein, partial [Candidatus Methylomirabilales bacterium]